MRFSPETIDKLAKLKECFEKESQGIFEDTYLKPFNGSPKANLYALPVERITHGTQHAARVAAYIPILVRFCKSIGYPDEISSITDEEITLLQFAALFHDAGRKNDTEDDKWEQDSADLFLGYLKKNEITDPAALNFSKYITRQKKDLLNTLLETADSLDIMRAKPSLQLEKTPLFTQLRKKKDRELFIKLATHVRQLIADQFDLRDDCSINYHDRIIVPAIPKTRNAATPSIKQAYEQAPNCYETITADFGRYPYLYQENIFEQACIWLSYDKKMRIYCFATQEAATRALAIVKKQLAQEPNIHLVKITKRTDISTVTPFSFRLTIAQSDQLKSMHDATDEKQDEKNDDAHVLDKAVISLAPNKKQLFFCFATSEEALNALTVVVQKLPDAPNIGNLQERIKKRTSQSTPTPFYFSLTPTQSQQLKTEILLDTFPLIPPADFIFKSLRADALSFTHTYIKMVVPIHGITEHHTLRFGDKRDYTVLGTGVFQRKFLHAHDDIKIESEEEDLPVKQPQYTSQQKSGFSKAQSASLGTRDHWSPIFGHGQGGGKRAALAGTLLGDKDCLFSDRLYIYDGGTVSRPFDFNSRSAAETYFKKTRGTILFSSSPEDRELFKQAASAPKNKGKYNEVLVRQRWNCQSSKVFIGNDNLESRLQAQEYARLIKQYLVMNGVVNDSYQVPIVYYTPHLLHLHFKPYLPIERACDELEAYRIFNDEKLNIEKYRHHHYQFLFALSPKDIVKALKIPLDNALSSEECLVDRLLCSGYIHVLTTLADKLNLPLIDLIDQFSKIHRTESPFAWYHLVRTNHHEAADRLLLRQKEIDFDAVNADKESILLLAAKTGDTSLLSLVVEKNVDPNIQNKTGETALSYAAYYDNLDSVKILLSCPDINPNLAESNNKTALYYAQHKHGNLDIVQTLIQAGAINPGRFQPIHIAVNQGRLQRVKALLETQPALLEKVDAYGQTPLFYAACGGHVTIVKYLISKKADINARSTDCDLDSIHWGRSALHWAVAGGHLSIVDIFLAQDNLSFKLTAMSLGAIHLAIQKGRLGMVKVMLEKRPELIEQAAFYNQTPLLVAVRAGQLTIVKYLISKGAITDIAINNPGHKDHGKAPLYFAADQKNDAMVLFLLKNGAKSSWKPIDIHQVNDSVRYPLVLAEYIKTREREATYKNSFSFFCWTRNFGYSKTLKVNAAQALMNVLINDAKPDTLQPHQAVLKNGNLGRICQQIQSQNPAIKTALSVKPRPQQTAPVIADEKSQKNVASTWKKYIGWGCVVLLGVASLALSLTGVLAPLGVLLGLCTWQLALVTTAATGLIGGIFTKVVTYSVNNHMNRKAPSFQSVPEQSALPAPSSA